MARDVSRELAMVAAYRGGKTLQQIGTEYGLTRERVRQIVARHGLSGADGGARVARQKAAALVEPARDQDALRKYGCSAAQYRDIRAAHGRPVAAFRKQRSNAVNRGIAWDLTLLQWWAIWQQSGHWRDRGSGAGRYCMARHGDIGPYSEGNVSIVPTEVNARDARTKAKPHAPEAVGVLLSCPGLKKPYLARYSNVTLGYHATIAEAQAARKQHIDRTESVDA